MLASEFSVQLQCAYRDNLPQWLQLDRDLFSLTIRDSDPRCASSDYEDRDTIGLNLDLSGFTVRNNFHLGTH